MRRNDWFAGNLFQEPRRGADRRNAGLISLAIGISAFATAAGAADYTVLTSGLPSGTMSVTTSGAKREIAFAFIDRGRGPDLRSTVNVDEKGQLSQLTTTGLSYYKLPVDERLEKIGPRASWKAANDDGTSEAGGFYLPDERIPEHLAILARALLKAPGASLPLLPAGEARLARLSERDFIVNGKNVKARLYSISGLSFAPLPLWLDGEGELIFHGSDWFATVRKGFEPHSKAILALQREALVAAARSRTSSWLHRPAVPIAFTGVRLFDSNARAIRKDMTVVVENERIRSVGPASSAVVPEGSTIIDGRGKTLLPGLWDMHVHLSNDVQGSLHLAAGVTSVRDLANNAEELAARKALYDRMELPGPRVTYSGFIDGPGPLAGPIKVLAATPDEMRSAIRGYADSGYKAIKLYSSLDPALIPIAVEEAHRLGLRVSGHVPAKMTLSDVSAAGFDEVHHINFVALNFMGPEINARTNGITRITAMAEYGWKIDPSSPEVQALVSSLKARGTVIDPTLSLYEDDLLGRPGQPDPRLVPVLDRLPPVVRREAQGGGLAKSGEEIERNAKSYRVMMGLVKALHDGGVTLVAGTDESMGFTFHRELEVYEQAGIGRGDILHIATLGAARVAGLEQELGSIEEGKLADLLLVEGNPLQRMSDIRNTLLVVKDGVPFDPANLYAEVGVAPASRRLEAAER